MIEEAVKDYALKSGMNGRADVFAETSGAWSCDKSPEALQEEIKKRFSMTRHHRSTA